MADLTSVLAQLLEMFVDGRTITTGTGDPNGTVVAAPGSIYLRSDGGAATTLYVKHTTSDSANWAAK